MKMLLKWGTRVSLLQICSGIIAFGTAIVLIGDQTTRAEVACLGIGCIAAALVATTVAFCSWWMSGDMHYPHSEKCAEEDITFNFGISGAVAAVLLLMVGVLRVHGLDVSIAAVTATSVSLLSIVAIVFLAVNAAKTMPYVFIQHEPFWARFITSLPLVGPVLGRLAQHYLLPHAMVRR